MAQSPPPLPSPLVAKGLSFAYRAGLPVLQDLDATFEPGCLTALVGPNGSGKSTFLRCLLGLRKPQKGQATLGGRDLATMRESTRALALAYIPQSPSAALGFTVLDVVAMGCGPRIPSRKAHRMALEALERVHLEERAREPFNELSLGQQQRTVVARALTQIETGRKQDSGVTPALIADEPTSAMDPRHALETLDLLRSLASEGVIVVAALHDLSAAWRFADRVVVLHAGGRIAAQGSADEVLGVGTLESVFGTPFVAMYQPAQDGRPPVRALVPSMPTASR